jgi:hypothetical protein
MFKVFLSTLLISTAAIPAFAQDIGATLDMSPINVPQVVESAPPPPPPAPAYVEPVQRAERAAPVYEAPAPVAAARAPEQMAYVSAPPRRLESVGIAAPIDQPDVSRDRGDRGNRSDGDGRRGGGGGDRGGDRGGGGWATSQSAPPPPPQQAQSDGGRGAWGGGNRDGGSRHQEGGGPRGRDDNEWRRERPQQSVPQQAPSPAPRIDRGGGGGSWMNSGPVTPPQDRGRPDRGQPGGNQWGGDRDHRDPRGGDPRGGNPRGGDPRGGRDHPSGGWDRDHHNDHGRDRDRNRGNHGGYNQGWNNNYGWNNGGSYRDWNRGWRENNRYNWENYRYQNRNLYRSQRYTHPYGYNYSYRRFSIGFHLDDLFYSSRYWLNEPWQYRLPDVYGPYRWVRYYDDVLLVDVRSGRVVDVVYDFFW